MTFFKMRDGIFHEDGYCLEAPALRRDSNATFVSVNRQGKPVKMAQVPGCEGTADPQGIIHLRPWPQPEKARRVITIACASLKAAIAGDHEARKTLADCWAYLTLNCLPREEKFAGLCNLHGKARVDLALNVGSMAALAAQEFVERVDEVFDRKAA